MQRTTRTRSDALLEHREPAAADGELVVVALALGRSRGSNGGRRRRGGVRRSRDDCASAAGTAVAWARVLQTADARGLVMLRSFAVSEIILYAVQ
ncbi:MAG: hypothetical protein ACOC3H_00055 [bacterium]